jgi:hypothetical protein
MQPNLFYPTASPLFKHGPLLTEPEAYNPGPVGTFDFTERGTLPAYSHLANRSPTRQQSARCTGRKGHLPNRYKRVRNSVTTLAHSVGRVSSNKCGPSTSTSSAAGSEPRISSLAIRGTT